MPLTALTKSPSSSRSQPSRSGADTLELLRAGVRMFTGIVTDVGEVLAVEPQAEGLRRLRIACSYDRASIAHRRFDRLLRRLPDRGRDRRGKAAAPGLPSMPRPRRFA